MSGGNRTRLDSVGAEGGGVTEPNLHGQSWGDLTPREGYTHGPLVGRYVLSGSGALRGYIVGQQGVWIDVRWEDGKPTFDNSRLFPELRGV